MPKKSLCVKVLRIYGEKTIILANKLEIANRELGIQRNSDFIYVPLIRQPQENELEKLKKNIPNFKILTHTFSEKKMRVKTFTELLEDKLPPNLLASLPRAIDVVGDIAIIEIPQELNQYKAAVGEAVLKTHKNARTVLAKAGAVGGTYRTREFKIIAGQQKTDTVHKEYGCQYYVDLAKAYFSPRLSHEHKRVASLVEEGETVIDLFAGVGPFSILIAKTHENVNVYAVDVNPHAIEFLQKNIRLNRVDRKVHPILGDAKQIVKNKLSGVADRVIMNLPEKAIEFVEIACEALKPTGGILHFYAFVDASNTLEYVKTRFTSAVEKSERKVGKFLFSRFVRATAPYEWQIVLDAEIH
jgi:tRNA (guanine37-N1)-methyltransferase